MSADLPSIVHLNNNNDTPNSAIGAVSGNGIKTNGGLRVTEDGYAWEANSTTSLEGLWFDWDASATYAKNLTGKLFCVSFAFNANNRIQLSTLSNGAHSVYLSSNATTPANDYKRWSVGGNDTVRGATPAHLAVVIDPDATAQGSAGTFDKTSTDFWGMAMYYADYGGGLSSYGFVSRTMIIDHSSKTATDMPKVYGTGCTIKELAEDTIGGTYNTTYHTNAQQIGTTIFLGMPFTIGKASNSTTFNDEGYTVISPGSNETADPRYHLTTSSMRVYLNLQTSDTATFSGTYVWGTMADFDFDTTQTVTFSSPTFNGIGNMTVGSGVTGPANWLNAGTITMNGCDIDGSTFNGCTTLNVDADIANMTISNSTNGITIDTAGTYQFSNVQFSGNTNDVHLTHSTGTVTINIVGGGDVPTISNTGGGSYAVNQPVTVSVHAEDLTGTAISGARVLLKASTGGDLPAGASVSITRSGSTATVTHTSHGLSTSDQVVIAGANEDGYNGLFTITVTGTNTYTYTLSGTPATPATGTITATAVVLSGTTDASGNISDTAFNYTANQPVVGTVRKASSAPYYKATSLVGTITTAGLAITSIMSEDS